MTNFKRIKHDINGNPRFYGDAACNSDDRIAGIDSWHPDAETALANAHLIAAAPDLYTALDAFSSAVWLDPRLPEDMREQLKAVYHNQVLVALERAK